jgi:hypothetical protein
MTTSISSEAQKNHDRYHCFLKTTGNLILISLNIKRIGEKSQKPAERQSDRHGCFL